MKYYICNLKYTLNKPSLRKTSQAYGGAVFGKGSGSIEKRGVKCEGSEESIDECETIYTAVCQVSYVYSPLYFIQKPKIILCTKLNFHQSFAIFNEKKRLANLVPLKSLNEK